MTVNNFSIAAQTAFRRLVLNGKNNTVTGKGTPNYFKTTYIINTFTINKIFEVLNRNFNNLSLAFAKQCNAIAVQRVRRSAQIISFYRKFYDKNALKQIAGRFGCSLLQNAKNKPLQMLFGATLFSWANERISDKDMRECADDLNHLPKYDINGNKNASQCKDIQVSDDSIDCWETVINSDNFKVWRRPIRNTHLYEYKVFGRFFDIPARAFYRVQVDLEYRKSWDRLVIKLETIDRDNESGSEIVHWITHYPFPMYSRDYVYVRRYCTDPESKTLVLVSRAVDHPSCPVSKKYVRVSTYVSQMAIRPHTGIDDNGFDYVLRYYDDPQAVIPSAAYNWMATSGVPDFVEKLHVAAKKLCEKKHSTSAEEESENETVASYS